MKSRRGLARLGGRDDDGRRWLMNRKLGAPDFVFVSDGDEES